MPGNNNINNNSNYQNPQLMQQQFGQQGNSNFPRGMPGMAGHNQQQSRGGTPLQQQQQQRMMQLEQMQRQQQSHTTALGTNPMSSPLARPNTLAPASSSGSLPRMNSSSSVNSKSGKGGTATAPPKPPTLAKGISLSDALPPTKLNSSVSFSSHGGGASQGKGAASADQMTEHLLDKCDWKDKTIWVSRQLLGGNATNGFLRSTATVQRIKRQRARQTAQTKQKQASGDDKKKGKDDKDKDSKDDKSKKRDAPDQAAEEELKKEVMNPRTAKKIKAELQAGLGFCVTLHNTIRSILSEIDPQVAPHTPLPLHQGGEVPTMKQLMPGNPKLHPAAFAQQALASQSAAPKSTASASTTKGPASAPPSKQPPSSNASRADQRRPSDESASKSTQASPGEPGGSTLRKNRKKKLPPSNEKPVALSEFDASGKRLFSKKEHTFRVFEAIRFRALKQGDFVAARVSSRDLWILARVQKDYPGFTMPPAEFLKMTEAKRDASFREKVQIKDVEDKGGGGPTMVSRNLVLPLPRTFSEAAEWCQRCKKGARVYAMYPHTTSLYSATVIDNTTYCRQDDDIIVVEFDGDESDGTGALPKYHIPARFVTLIPREFPASQTNSKKRKSVTSAQAPLLPNASKNKRSSVSSTKSSNDNNDSSSMLPEEDPLGSMIGQMGFEDLVSTNSLDDLEQFDFDFSDIK